LVLVQIKTALQTATFLYNITYTNILSALDRMATGFMTNLSRIQEDF